MLRATSDSDVEDYAEFVVGFLESIFPNVISKKLFKNFYIESAPLFSGSP
jgi:hypothetical protein